MSPVFLDKNPCRGRAPHVLGLFWAVDAGGMRPRDVCLMRKMVPQYARASSCAESRILTRALPHTVPHTVPHTSTHAGPHGAVAARFWEASPRSRRSSHAGPHIPEVTLKPHILRSQTA